jgi:hypothetical protein
MTGAEIPIGSLVSDWVSYAGRGITRLHFEEFVMDQGNLISVKELEQLDSDLIVEYFRSVGTMIGPWAVGDPASDYPPVASWAGMVIDRNNWMWVIRLYGGINYLVHAQSSDSE